MKLIKFSISRRLLSSAANEPDTITAVLKKRYLKKEYEVSAADKALLHFDRYYPLVYGTDLWASLRLALLSPKRHLALVNPYSQKTSDLINRLQEMEAHNVVQEWNHLLCKADQAASNEDPTHQLHEENHFGTAEHLDEFENRTNLSEFVKVTEVLTEHCIINSTSKPVKRMGSLKNYFEVKDDQSSMYMSPYLPPTVLPPNATIVDEALTVPTSWMIFGFHRHQFQSLGRPQSDGFGQIDFYPLDGGSLLPVCALNLQQNDRVLDMCSAPGGKALAIKLSGFVRSMTCVDASSSRLSRLYNVLSSHCGLQVNFTGFNSSETETSKEENVIELLLGDSANPRTISTGDLFTYGFNKVLVDVPCSADRHSCTNPMSNLFDRGRQKERLALFDRQKRLLKSGLMICAAGGDVVYSTCSLSPAQNSAVVVESLSELYHEMPEQQFSISDFCQSANSLKGVFRFYEPNLPHKAIGLTLLPHVASNYGPTYICKIHKI